MTYPDLNAPLRADQSFSLRSDESHHIGITPLAKMELNLVSNVVLDYMHLICLGVMRRMLLLWMQGPFLCRQSQSLICAISEHLLELRDHVPSEFARKPRSLKEIKRWKATELRQFLLYTRPIVLYRKLPLAIYQNFLLFFVGVRILLDKNMCKTYNSYVKEILQSFVKHFSEIYGSNMVVYNVHNVIHVADDALIHGSLENISSFPFENFMGNILKLVKKPSQPLQQVIRRLSELKEHDLTYDDISVEPTLRIPSHSGPMPENLAEEKASQCRQFKKCQCKNFVIGINNKDNCVFIDEDIVLVKNILKSDSEIFIVYQKFLCKNSFFDYPVNSSFLDVFEVSDLNNVVKCILLSNVTKKAIIFPFRSHHITIPLIHRIS